MKCNPRVEDRHIILRITPMQAQALNFMCAQSDDNWLQGQPGTKPMMKATRQCIKLVAKAERLAYRVNHRGLVTQN